MAKKQGSTYRFRFCTLRFVYSCSRGSFWVDPAELCRYQSINWSLPTRTNRSQIHAIDAPKLWVNGVVAKLEAHLVVTRLEVTWLMCRGAEWQWWWNQPLVGWWVGFERSFRSEATKHLNLLKPFWLMIGVLHLRLFFGISFSPNKP